ncbi:MAG: aldose 1-epimerase [Cytophagales bacterium]|nr:aldose 1-epimerase [Cytophagales bacterium]
MFILEKIPFGTCEVFRLKNDVSNEYVDVIPSFGGAILGLVLSNSGELYSLINGCIDSEELMSTGRQEYRGSKLSPFPNRVKQGKYSFEGVEYQLYPNASSEGNALHGFLFDKEFDVLEERFTRKSAELTLGYEYRGENEGFPFFYKIKINYVLNSDGFYCTTQIENLHKSIIPIADGWHPYIQLGPRADHWSLRLPSKYLLETDAGLIPTGKILETEKFQQLEPVLSEKFDTCYVLNAEAPLATVEIYNPENGLRLIFWMESGSNKYNYLQIYIPPSRESIAIEPMTCAPNAFNNGLGLIHLKPGQTIDFTFGIRLG